MAESFDAVLADARLELKHSRPTYAEIEGYFDRLQSAHEAEVAERDARLNGAKFAHEQTRRALAEATETWVDDAGTVWRVPTAWAYAQSCRVRDEQYHRAEAAGRDARRAVGLLREVPSVLAYAMNLCNSQASEALQDEAARQINSCNARIREALSEQAGERENGDV